MPCPICGGPMHITKLNKAKDAFTLGRLAEKGSNFETEMCLSFAPCYQVIKNKLMTKWIVRSKSWIWDRREKEDKLAQIKQEVVAEIEKEKALLRSKLQKQLDAAMEL